MSVSSEIQFVRRENLRKCSAFVEHYNNGAQILVSYTTPVAGIDQDGQIFVGPEWDCSITTHKHVRYFLGLYAEETRARIKEGRIIKADSESKLVDGVMGR